MTASSLRTRVTRGLGAQGLARGIQTFIRLAEVPLFLRFWGLELYGEWLIVAAIPTYLSMADAGFTTTTNRDIAMRAAAGDRDGAIAAFRSTWLLLCGVSVAVFAVAALLIAVLPLGGWLHFRLMSGGTMRVVLLLLVVDVLLGFQGGLMDGGFWVEGRYPAGMALSALTQLLEFLGIAIAVISGHGPLAAAAGFLAGTTLGLLVTRIALYRATPWLRFGWRGASRAEIRRLTAPSFASLAFPLGNAFNLQGMRIVIGAALGPAAVAVFSPLRTLSRMGKQPTEVVNRIAEPELAMAFGADDHELFRRLFRRACQVALWLGAAACAALVVIGAGGLKLWTQGKVPLDWPLFGALLAAAFANSLWNTALMAPYATNRHARVAVVYAAVYGVGAFALAYAGARVVGLRGVGAALVVAELAMAAYVVPFSLRLTGDRWSRWLEAVVTPPWFLLESLRGAPAARPERTES